MSARTFVVETYGCQMNVHDTERIAGLLLDAGYEAALEGSTPDLVVFNTCAVRENADNKLYGNLSFLAPLKKSNPDFQIAVGGCMAQKDQESIIKLGSTTSAIASLESSIPPRTDCSATKSCGGVRSNSIGRAGRLLFPPSIF